MLPGQIFSHLVEVPYARDELLKRLPIYYIFAQDVNTMFFLVLISMQDDSLSYHFLDDLFQSDIESSQDNPVNL